MADCFSRFLIGWREQVVRDLKFGVSCLETGDIFRKLGFQGSFAILIRISGFIFLTPLNRENPAWIGKDGMYAFLFQFLSISFQNTFSQTIFSLNIANFKNFIGGIKKYSRLMYLIFKNIFLFKILEYLLAPFKHILLDIHIIHQFTAKFGLWYLLFANKTLFS
jgi:hypothetical protein